MIASASAGHRGDPGSTDAQDPGPILSARARWAILLLLVTRLGLLFWGSDRLPFLSSSDESHFNDVALSLSRGEGYRMPAMRETLSMGSYYGQHPPLYLWLQSGAFGLWGITPLALRASNILFHGLAPLLLLVLCANLARRGRIGRSGTLWAIVIYAISTCGSLSMLRQGRPDGMAILLGLASLALSTAGAGQARARTLLPAGILMGLSLSTHLETIIFLPTFIWLLLDSRASARARVLSMVLIPLTWTAVWLAFQGPRWLDSLHQMAAIMAHGQVDMDWLGVQLNSLPEGRWFDFVRTGGVSLWVILSSWMALAARGLADGREGPRRSMVLMVLVQALAMFCVLGFQPPRIVTFMPLAALYLGMALPDKGLGRATLNLLLGCIVAIELLGWSSYYGKLANEWEERDPRMYQSLLRSLGPEERLAGETDFWFEARAQGREYRFIAAAERPDRAYWTVDPRRALSYDVLLLREKHYLTPRLDPAAFYVERTWRTPTGTYQVHRRRSPAPARPADGKTALEGGQSGRFMLES